MAASTATELWDPHWYGPTKTVDVHVASIRPKLQDPGWIEAVRGVGFRFETQSGNQCPLAARTASRHVAPAPAPVTFAPILHRSWPAAHLRHERLDNMPATMNEQMDPRQDVQHAPRPGSDILPGITVADRVFPVMGSAAHVLVVLDPDRSTASADHLLEAACKRLGQLEDRWSRFRPGSEISRLNRAEGAPVAVTADTLELLARCVHGWRATSGLFDPSVHDALVRLGYDRSIELLPPPPPVTSAPPHPVPIGIMPTGIIPISMVPDGTVPMGTAPTGIMPTGMAAPGGGPGWQMLVEGASAAPGCGSVELDRGAGTARLGPGVAIDPGGSAGWWAEALAKAAFVAGMEGARGLLSAMGATGLAVRTDGTIEPFAGLTPYLR